METGIVDRIAVEETSHLRALIQSLEKRIKEQSLTIERLQVELGNFRDPVLLRPMSKLFSEAGPA